MQSYCIYAEAFAGPFRPLRAPEPPFTHKTPPFTQVLFLFDAFYGTISLRKPSSLCSYKTESEDPMKKRILALLLAFSMMLSLLPVSALADTGGGIGSAGYTSNGLIGGMPDLVMDNDTGRPDPSRATKISEGVYQGNGWRYVPQDSARNDKDTLYLDGASFNLSGASIWCNVVVSPRTTVENASFNYHDNPSGFPSVTNNGILQSCMFIECNITNNSTIQKSTIEDCSITNNATIRDSLFSINSSATLPFKFEKSGSITDSVFDFNPTTYGLTLNVHSLQASPIKALDISTASNPITYLYLRSNVFYTIGYPKIKVYCYNPDNPTGGSYKVCSINGVPATSYAPDFGYANDSYIFTVQDEDVELSSSETTAPALEMNYNGWPKTDNMTPINNVYYGDGWTYDGTTLTLKSGEYDFTHTEPRNTASSRYGDSVKCNIVVKENAAITGGILDGNSLTNSGTVKDILFMGYWLTNNNGTLSCLLGPSVYDHPSFTRHTVKAVDGSEIYYTVNQQSTGNGKQLYFTGTPKFTVKLENSTIHYINGEEHYGGLTSPDGKGYQTFTPPEEEDIVLNREPYATDLVMTTDGIPDITNVAGGKDGTHFSYKGDGWTFTGAADIPDAIGTLTLNKNTNSYDFRYLDPLNGPGGELAAVKCPLMNDGATIENGVFKNLVINHRGTIRGGTFAVGLFSINSEDFSTSGTVTGGAFNGKDGLSDGYHAVTVNGGSIRKVNDTEPLEAHEINDSYGLRYDIVQSTEWNLYSYAGTIVTVTADTDITNINGWNIGRFRGSSYPNGEDDKKTVSFQMPDGPVVLNDTLYTLDIIRGTMLGNTSVSVPAGTELKLEADEPAEDETFLGWTLSDESLLTKGTLNDPNCKTITIKMNDASATAEAMFQKDTPAYTLTVTGGGLVNGKTSAVVEAGKEVCLTVGEMQEGMSFNYWDLPTALIKALTDSSSGGFSNKVEPLTFTMPDLSEYTEDTRFTIRLDIRPAELPDDDDGPSVLGTMATVAVGGAAAGILVWQGVSLGVDSYLQLSLPGGVPVPTNRRELVVLLWETAGKPDVVLPALYGDVSAEDGELQKATRWAIDNGLVKSADETDASRFDPDRSVSKYEVARAWFKVQQMLK